MNCVLLGGKTNQNIRVHKQRKKRENKGSGETPSDQQTLVAFGDMQQQRECIGDSANCGLLGALTTVLLCEHYSLRKQDVGGENYRSSKSTKTTPG